jgi:hypothetical protein
LGRGCIRVLVEALPGVAAAMLRAHMKSHQSARRRSKALVAKRLAIEPARRLDPEHIATSEEQCCARRLASTSLAT